VNQFLLSFCGRKECASATPFSVASGAWAMKSLAVQKSTKYFCT
jgi:hypothetical protein